MVAPEVAPPNADFEIMPLDALMAAVQPFVNATYAALPAPVFVAGLAAVRSHLTTFADINDAFHPLFHAPATAVTLTDEQRAVNTIAAEQLRTTVWDEAGIAAALKQVGANAGVKGRALYEPLRLAVTGELHGPPFVPLLLVRGREDVVRRIEASCAH